MSSLDPLGAALERTVPAQERHGRGQYFTPDALVRFVLSLVAVGAKRPMKVLDPACGSGRFLLGAKERWGEDNLELFGYETDPEARGHALQQLGGASISERSFLAEGEVTQVDLVVGNPPYIRRRGAKRDLYVDFIARSFDHLGDGGRLAFVLSNAWLSVGYGRCVRELLLERFAVEWIIESVAESWFRGASVNTMILVARRCDDPAERARQPVRFAHLRSPLPAQAHLVRAIPQARLTTWDAWAPLLRAPDLFLELSGSASTCSLGKLAGVHRGFTTNDNAFFYPPSDSGVEEEFLQPLVKGPRDVPGLRCRSSELPHRVLLCDEQWEDLKGPRGKGLRRWLRKHSRGRDTAAWRLRPQERARLFLAKGYHDRFRQALSDEPVYVDQQIYGVHPLGGRNATVMAALLNSAWFQLALELTGRVNFGDGVLWLGLQDARERLTLPDPLLCSSDQQERLMTAFCALPGGRVPALGELRADTVWSGPRERLDRELAGALGVSWAEYLDLQLHGEILCARRLSLAAGRRGAPKTAIVGLS
jgi:SAM-dependent methyltransferase